MTSVLLLYNDLYSDILDDYTNLNHIYIYDITYRYFFFLVLFRNILE